MIPIHHQLDVFVSLSGTYKKISGYNKTMEYDIILVQSVLSNESGQRGPIHIKPLPNQEPYSESMFVQCSKVLSNEFPVGTKFKIKAKIIVPIGKRPFISSHYTWPFEVIKQ